MALLLIFSLVGILVGATVFYQGGWLIGGVLGFLIAQAIQTAKKIARLERELNSLQKQTASVQKEQITALTTAQFITPATHVDAVQQPEYQPSLAEQIQTPVAELATSVDTPLSDRELEALALGTMESGQVINSQPNTIIPTPTATHYQPRAQSTEPAQPNPIDKVFNLVRRFFTEGNPIVRIGMVVMLFGLSFLVKYASSQGMLPIELRLAAVGTIAIALIVIGWKTRAKEGGYGLVLQGGGIGALYLTLFAAAKMYALMPSGVAFGLMFIIVMLGAALAVLQNAQVLALMATAGGFLAPILTSDGSGNHVGLFSFYLLLNIGILAIAWFKTWRLLNWVGFVFTFVITSAWGVLKYEPHLYFSTQPFLLAFFALYLLVSILFSLKQPPNLKGAVDGSLVFGLPIVGFGLQTALLKHTEYGLAISAIILAAIYILLARVLWTKYRQTHRVLIESFIALGVTFATLTIPLALDAQWTSASWALEAAGLIWVGLRQQRLLPRVAGYLLHIAAAFSLLIHGIDASTVPIITGDFIGLFILAASAICISYLLYRFTEHCLRLEKNLAAVSLVVGWLWWLVAGYVELEGHLSGEHLFPALIVFFTISTAALVMLSQKIHWPQLAGVGFWLLPLTALWVMRNFGEALFLGYAMYPSQAWGWLALLVFFVVNYRFLWQKNQQGIQASKGLLSAYHVLSAWFLFCLVFWEATWWQNHFNWFGTSAAVLWFMCLMAPLTALVVLTAKNIWPFNAYTDDYKNLIPAPLLFLLLIWFIKAATYSGITTQFYLPILNPLDLAQLAVVLLFAYALKRNFVRTGDLAPEIRYGLLGSLGFVWINIVLLRAIHHYTGIAYDASIMWDSAVVQMALSILWAVCALVIMNISRRLQKRQLWMLGAGLLGLIVVKLAFKDLSGSGTLAGIVSFMVVGALMLLIGYLSPIPAKTKINQEVNN